MQFLCSIESASVCAFQRIAAHRKAQLLRRTGACEVLRSPLRHGGDFAVLPCWGPFRYAPRTPATAAPMPPPCIPTLRGCAGAVLTCQLQVTRALPSGAQTPAAGGYALLAGHSSCPEPTRGHRYARGRLGERPELLCACVGAFLADSLFAPESLPKSQPILTYRLQ